MKPADGAHRGVEWSRGGTRRRLAPSVFQYDFLVLRLLQKDIRQALASVGRIESEDAVAIDIGGGDAPYRSLLEAAGYRVQCLDIAQTAGVDIVGSAEHTGLPDESVDLVLCDTSPGAHTSALVSDARIRAHPATGWRRSDLRPACLVLSPAPIGLDWRMTSQGLRALCDEGGLDVVDLRAQGGSAAALFPGRELPRLWSAWPGWCAAVWSNERTRSRFGPARDGPAIRTESQLSCEKAGVGPGLGGGQEWR